MLDGGSRLHHICKPLPEYHAPYVRFNDGACDKNGRFFVGTIHSKDRGIPGKLWMYDPATSECRIVDEGPFTVSYCASLFEVSLLECTGLEWTWLESGWKDHASMRFCSVVRACLRRNFRYFTDSLANLIYAYDFEDGKLSNRRIIVDAIAQGLPEKTFCDGLCIDEAGYIWSARFVGWLLPEHFERLLADGEALVS